MMDSTYMILFSYFYNFCKLQQKSLITYYTADDHVTLIKYNGSVNGGRRDRTLLPNQQKYSADIINYHSI